MGETAELNCTIHKIKNQTSGTVTTKALAEDAFSPLYVGGGGGVALEPPCSIERLERYVEENNALRSCIDAYAVNISGTGVTLLKDGVEVAKEDDSNGFYDFFKRCNLKQSLTTVRKKLTRYVEGSGNGYLEYVRSIDGTLMFLNALPATNIRLVRLGDPIVIPVQINRFGRVIDMSVSIRPRAYVQSVDGMFVYFKEAGVPIHINAKTGEWGENIPYEDRGTELVHYTAIEAVDSPYGLPRWYSQIPSVVGSRKAEELNVGFFSAGGVPPAIVFVTGGLLKSGVATQLENIFNASPTANSGRAAVVEVQGSGGSLDKETVPKVSVEKFDEDGDSRWENYDAKCESRVRGSFRLPPLFVGKTDDYNFASAYTSYLVAEAQVFAPERFEFDEQFNNTVMLELDPTGRYTIRSKPVSIANVETQLKALGVAGSIQGVSKQPMVEVLSGILGVELEYDESKDVGVREVLQAMGGATSITDEDLVEKSERENWVSILAQQYINTFKKGEDFSEADRAVAATTKGLTGVVKDAFYTELSKQLFHTPGLKKSLDVLDTCGELCDY